MSMEDDLRAKAVGSVVRFEIFEHDGATYAVRQSSPRIAKAIAKHGEDNQGGLAEMVLQTVHAAVPVIGPDGAQLTETVEVPQVEPVLDEKGVPVLVPVLDVKGRPVISAAGKALLEGEMRPVLDADGKQRVETLVRPKFSLGQRLFDKSHFDTFMEAPNDEDGFIGKVLAASLRVNSRKDARLRAKKS